MTTSLVQNDAINDASNRSFILAIPGASESPGVKGMLEYMVINIFETPEMLVVGAPWVVGVAWPYPDGILPMSSEDAEYKILVYCYLSGRHYA